MRFVPAVASAILALNAGGSASALNCKAPANQIEVDQCAGRDFNAADARLNVLYRSMMSRYDAPNQQVLKAAEKAWLSYRDAECSYETNVTVGGTINSTMFTQCKAAKTNARVKELNAQLHCADGDLSCNAPSK